MKKLINIIRTALLLKLLDHLCDSRNCRYCEAYLKEDNKYHCAHMYIVDQSTQVWLDEEV